MDDKDIFIFREKVKHRAEVVGAVENRKLMEKTIKDLQEWVDKLHFKLVDAKASAKLSKKYMCSEKLS